MVVWILRLTSVFIFVGRALEHFFWKPPYTRFFWNQDLLETPLRWFGIQWEAYASHSIDGIFMFQYAMGVLLVLAALACLWPHSYTQRTRWIVYPITLGSTLLFLLTLLKWQEKWYQLGQLIEYTSQWATPLLYVYLMRVRTWTTFMELCTKIAIALTFIGHGFYAAGIHPVPGHFIDMMIIAFHLQEDTIRVILLIVGILDIMAAVCLFYKRTALVALWYCAFWGFVTALARLYTNIETFEFWLTWGYEFMVRTSHYSLAIILLYGMYKKGTFKINA